MIPPSGRRGGRGFVSTPLPAQTESFDLLIVDDDEFIRTMLVTALERRGYSLRWAGDGRTALQLLARCRFRLVITDVFMPDLDGLELIMTRSGANSTTPILAISGGPEYILKCARQLGCRRTLQKPFEIPEFLAAVADFVSQPAGSAPVR